MNDLANKDILVIGLGSRGSAACELLRTGGANVVVVDSADTPELRTRAARLKTRGVTVRLGTTELPDQAFAFAVVSPAVRPDSPIMRALAEHKILTISELELGFQQARCLTLAVAGTNGKGTTAELIEQLLLQNGRKTVLCGHGAQPICAVATETSELDYLVLQVNSFQLETTRFFRPSVAVLLNLAPDHLDRYTAHADYVRANARVFANQQVFDWAIVQSEALAQLRTLKLPIPAKVITFSANNRRADIYLDRGMLISRLPDWEWPLLDLSQCKLEGSHNAENLMAALAVGHVLRLPLEAMARVLKAQPAGPHRFEHVLELNGVEFVNDSKATNLEALKMALTSAPGSGSEPNVWLIAGGVDKGLEYYDVGPLLSRRVKGAFLIGDAAEKLRAAWSLFTPCTMVDSLVQALAVAARNAVSGDLVLLSPACSSFDQFRNYQHRGEVFREAVKELAASAVISQGIPNPTATD